MDLSNVQLFATTVADGLRGGIQKFSWSQPREIQAMYFSNGVDVAEKVAELAINFAN